MKRSDVVLNSDAHRDAFEILRDAINAACAREGWRTGEAIRYWLEASFRAMRGAVVRGDAWTANEAEYMRIVARCQRPQETMADLARMTGALTLALEASPTDFVGPVFMAFAANDHAGQFFTPPSLSRAIAEMSFGDLAADIARVRESEGRGFLLCSEPACGVGGMVLEAHAVMKARGIAPHRQAHWIMVDIDFAAVCGAYLQANLCGVSATVCHGNALTLETWASTPTMAAILHPKRMPIVREIEVAPSPAPALAPAPQVDRKGQFSFAFVEGTP